MSKLAQLQEEVSELTREERAALMTTLAFADKNSNPGLNREERLVFDELAEASESTVTLKRFLDDFGRRKFGDRVDELYEFARSTRRVLRQVQVDALVKMAIRSIASELNGMGLPVTPKTILNHVTMARAAIDRRFPGYIAAGLLHRVVGG